MATYLAAPMTGITLPLPAAAPHATRDVPRARALALAHGWNAMAYQVVNEGILHWFSASGDAVVGYVRTHGVCIVAGAPICTDARLRDVITEWEAFAATLGCRACYFGAAGRVYDALHHHDGYSTVVLGAQPVWNPALWPSVLAASMNLRSQLARARNKGVTVSEWAPARVSADPRVRDCLRRWLATRTLPTLHFLVEPHTLHDLTGRRIFVAARGDTIVGFINASPVPARRGWLIEQFVRSDRAPNGTVESLIDCAMRTLAADGAAYVTLGLVPLRAGTLAQASGNPAWLTTTLALTRVYGRRFYNFDGLERFKTKFRPHEWEPIYAITAEPRFRLRTLYAIAAAFTKRSPVIAVAYGVLRSLRLVWRRVRRRFRSA